MSCLRYKDDNLFIDHVSLSAIAQAYDTPCYVYSRQQIEQNWLDFSAAFAPIPHRICYAVKANSNIAILNLFAKHQAGFDIVSLGELERVLAANGNVDHIIFSGVGKSTHEIERAIAYGIYCFDIESEAELKRINQIASYAGHRVNIALRINPNIDAQTHHYISTGLKENKFGIDIDTATALCQNLSAYPYVKLIGIAMHIGSQITELQPFLSAIDRMLLLVQQLKSINITLRHLNIGGGLGIKYKHETPPSIQEYANAVIQKIAGAGLELIIEPGRAMIANAGVLLTKVEYLKHLDHINFAIVDAGMNDLMRPALYQAWQNIIAVTRYKDSEKLYDIAGPVCESADFLGKQRTLALHENDLLVIDNAGAYGFSMSSNYNSRPRAAEILVDHDQIHLIRRRETISDLFATETIPKLMDRTKHAL